MNKKHLILVLILVLVSCAPASAPTSSIQMQQSGQNLTSPNWDYISFENMWGYPNAQENQVVISNAIYLWEQSNPDREIVTLQIIQQGDAYATSPEVMGISIYSKLKNP